MFLYMIYRAVLVTCVITIITQANGADNFTSVAFLKVVLDYATIS